MSRYFVPITQPQIRNSLLDFSPVNQGLNAIGEAQQNASRNALMRDQMAMQKDQQQWARGRAEKQDARLSAEQGGKMAMAIMQMQDGDPAKATAWQKYLQQYGDGNHSPEELDPRTGPKIAAAVFGYSIDPMERQTAQAKLDLMRAQTAAAGQRAETNPIDAMIAAQIARMGNTTPEAAGTMPPVQPQSAPGDGPMTVPKSPALMPIGNGATNQTQMPRQQGGLQFVSDEAQAMGAAPAQPSGDVIDVPVFGRMSRDQARNLGGMLQTNPKYSTLGKTIFDLANNKSGPSAMGTAATNEVDKAALSASLSLARLRDIKRTFKPEFQQILPRLKMLGARWGEKFGANISPDLQRDLVGFSKFKTAAFRNFNKLLKEISGTAVSAQELKRQQLEQPNPGETWHDGDSPSEFIAKVEAGQDLAMKALARMNWIKRKGFPFNKETAEEYFALDDMPSIIRERGNEIEREIQQGQPGIDPSSLREAVKERINEEFGI